MSDIKITRANYTKLRNDLLVLVEQCRAKALLAANEALVESYWGMGQRLSQETAVKHGESAARLIARLAPDLGVGRSALYRAIQFFRSYPKAMPSTPALSRLAWSSHIELLPLNDPQKRQHYAQLAVDHGWSRDDLRRAIRSNALNPGQAGAALLRPSGFLERPAPGRHAYQGEFERVVDGDTVIVRIDLGFDVWKSQRLRLRGIQALAVGTEEGDRARRFVEQRLDKGQPVVLRTYKLDKYGRYVADLFFGPEVDLVSPEEALQKGRFLNQELVTKGHAVLLSGAVEAQGRG